MRFRAWVSSRATCMKDPYSYANRILFLPGLRFGVCVWFHGFGFELYFAGLCCIFQFWLVGRGSAVSELGLLDLLALPTLKLQTPTPKP